MNKSELSEAILWYKNRRYDIGKDRMVSDTEPPECIAEEVRLSEKFDDLYDIEISKMYSSWRNGGDYKTRSILEIFEEVYGK